MNAAVDKNAFADDKIELRTFTSSQDCKALPVFSILEFELLIAIVRLRIHMPSIFDFVCSYVRKRIGVRRDRGAGCLKRQT